MKTVKVYIETTITGPSKPKYGKYAAALAFTRKNGKTEDRFLQGSEQETTYNRSVLLAMVRAMQRFKESCHIIFYTGNAELIDGRTDVDGEVHENIGDAMRGQARKLRGHLVVRQKEQPTDPNNNVWISDEDDEVEVPDMGEFNSLKEDIGDLKNILDEFPINFTRGYHVTYVSNGVTKVKESSDTASSAYQQRVKSPSYDKGVIPVGSSVICKGLATARVWFVTYENTLIGYTEFVKEYTMCYKSV